MCVSVSVSVCARVCARNSLRPQQVFAMDVLCCPDALDVRNTVCEHKAFDAVGVVMFLSLPMGFKRALKKRF